MAPLFPWPGRQLKETPIREGPISGVSTRGHAQVRLLFMSAKPIKTLQPTSLTPTRLSPWTAEEEVRAGSHRTRKIQAQLDTVPPSLSDSGATCRKVNKESACE